MSKSLSTELRKLLEQKVEEITLEAYDAAAETELVGIAAMRERVLAAVTPWGQARQAGTVKGPGGAGPREHAGRYETGEMYDGITGETERPAPDRIVATWGWKDPEDYYLAQEHGTEKIEAMESLHVSLHVAEDELVSRLKRI